MQLLGLSFPLIQFFPSCLEALKGTQDSPGVPSFLPSFTLSSFHFPSKNLGATFSSPGSGHRSLLILSPPFHLSLPLIPSFNLPLLILNTKLLHRSVYSSQSLGPIAYSPSYIPA